MRHRVKDGTKTLVVKKSFENQFDTEFFCDVDIYELTKCSFVQVSFVQVQTNLCQKMPCVKQP